MLNKRERLLLNVLVWVAIAAVFGVFTFFEGMKRIELRERIALIEEQMRRLQVKLPSRAELSETKKHLQVELKGLQSRFYLEEQMDPYQFGSVIRELLVHEGLSIKRYQTLEVGEDTLLEFSVSGDALGFFRFLEKISRSEKFWSVPFVSINARGGAGRIDSVVRIGYETIGSSDR